MSARYERRGDIYGTGVNVAVRLEGLADPGGILISDDAYRQIHDKLEIKLRDRGPQHLKNIDEPVRAYAVYMGSTDAIPSDAPKTKTRPSWRAGLAALVIAALVGALGWQVMRQNFPEDAAVAALERPSIAVLPFTNLSGDPEQQYFSDGLTEDLITELSRFPDILVFARNTTFQYRGIPSTCRPWPMLWALLSFWKEACSGLVIP